MRLILINIYWISPILDVLEFFPILRITNNQAMNFLMLFILCVLTLGLVLDTYFNGNVILTIEINPTFCDSS